MDAQQSLKYMGLFLGSSLTSFLGRWVGEVWAGEDQLRTYSS